MRVNRVAVIIAGDARRRRAVCSVAACLRVSDGRTVGETMRMMGNLAISTMPRAKAVVRANSRRSVASTAR
jgi:hypothetical protein